MEELGKGIKTIFEKVGDFFDIFDLSFFVSGIGTGSAFIYIYYLNHDTSDFELKSSFLEVLLIIIFFYIMGLISFAIGRFIRLETSKVKAYKKMDEKLRQVIKVHDLEKKQPFKMYLELPQEDRGAWRLYVRLWAKLRDEPRLSNSFSQVNRYWVMSATYDGVFLSLITWALTLGYLVFINRELVDIDKYWGSGLIIFLIIAALSCIREAKRNLFNQVEEIIAIAAIDEEI